MFDLSKKFALPHTLLKNRKTTVPHCSPIVNIWCINQEFGILHLVFGCRLMKRNKPLSLTSAAATVGPSGCFALTVIAWGIWGFITSFSSIDKDNSGLEQKVDRKGTETKQKVITKSIESQQKVNGLLTLTAVFSRVYRVFFANIWC